MQINPFYFRGPLLFLFAMLFWCDPSHSKISAEEPVVDEDVLDDLLEQEAGPASQRIKQIFDSFRTPSKPPTGEPDAEKLVAEGRAPKLFSEVTKLGEASTPIQSDPALLQKETADDGELDTGNVPFMPPPCENGVEDNPSRFIVPNVDGSKNCEWAADKKSAPKKRCSTDAVRSNCPVTCGVCSSQDYDGRGLKNSKKRKNKLKKTNKPTSQPSTSNEPSLGPSSTPSSLPSSQPSACEDDVDWKMPLHTTWGLSPLVNMTCADLEVYSTPENQEEWCGYLSVDVIDDKCAAEACCFCGGGTHVDVPCENIPGWQIGSGLGCEFIEESGDPAGFCDTYKEFLFNGMVPSDSCCVCGGGGKPVNHYWRLSSSSVNEEPAETPPFPPPSRKLEESPGLIHPSCDSTTCTIDKRDWTTRVGLGESGGVPNLEYLGIGYDSLRGNPRGSSISEVDPGKA
jgi:hypothetical protein